MAQELATLIREALKNSRENGYEPFDLPLEALATDLMLCDADIEKFEPNQIREELSNILLEEEKAKTDALIIEEEFSDALNQATGQELLDFAARVRSEGMLAMVDIITVDREVLDHEKQSKERIASLKEIIADSLEFIGKYKIARNM